MGALDTREAYLVKRYFGLSRCRPVSLVCLVSLVHLVCLVCLVYLVEPD